MKPVQNPIHLYRRFLRKIKNIQISNMKYVNERIRIEFEKNRDVDPELVQGLIKVIFNSPLES